MILTAAKMASCFSSMRSTLMRERVLQLQYSCKSCLSRFVYPAVVLRIGANWLHAEAAG